MSLLRSLAYAAKRVGNEMQDVAGKKGQFDYDVRVDIKGLERDESDRFIVTFSNIERSPVERAQDDELERDKRCYLTARVTGATSPHAALTIAVDAVRAALHEEGLAGQVTEFSAIARSIPASEAATP